MTEVIMHIDKEQVYEEVAKTTAYTGAKAIDGGDAYNRIPTIDEDECMLQRFWAEACSAAEERVKPFLTKAGTTEEGFTLHLELPSSYSPALTPGIRASLFSYLALYITAKWYALTNKEDAAACLTEAAGMLDDAVGKLYYRCKPRRPEVASSCTCKTRGI